MNIIHQRSEIKRILRKFLVISIIFSLLVNLAGCGKSVVAKWKEPFEQRTNEKVIGYDQPFVEKHNWDANSTTLNINLEQNKILAFDVEKGTQRVEALRKGDIIEDVSITIVGSYMTLGCLIPKFISEWIEFSKDEKATIKYLKQGREYGSAYSLSGKKKEYERKVVSRKVTNVTSNQRGNIIVPASQIPTEVLIYSSKKILTSGITNTDGWVALTMAETLSEASRLKPSELNVLAKWQGKWVEVGKIELTENMISQIIDKVTKESMFATGVSSLPPFPKVTVNLPENDVVADTESQLSLSVENSGRGAFYQLVVVSKSEIPALNGLKFEFGKLDPNDSLTLSKKVHIPRLQPTGPVEVNFVWTELNGYEPEPIQAKIMVKGLPRPVFATSVQVLDDNTGNSVGNGDGLIQKGEAVDLLVTTKNIGDGIARNVKISMDEISVLGVIINISEQQLGEIAVGESKQARLTVTTKRSAEIDKLTPTIRVVDEYFEVEHAEQLALALETELAPSIMAYNTQVYVGTEEIPVRGGAGNETGIIARAKPGTVLQATGELGNWIRVNLPSIGTGWVQRSFISFERTSQPTAVTQQSGGVIEILQKQPPLIAVARPLNNSKFNMACVEVSGVIADDQAVSLTEFKHNGQKIDLSSQRGVDRIDKAPVTAQRELNFSFTIDLAEGTNTIEITALDNEGLKAQKVVSVIYEKEQGNIYVVCIGIDQYKNVRPLKYAVADSQAVAERLSQCLNVPKENLYCLFNKDATLRNIRDILGVKVRERAGKADTVIIYFSGHGAPEADPWSPDGDGVAKYLLPIGAERSSLYSTALPMEEVRTIFRRLVSERVIFMADTCYSGEAGGRTLMPDGTSFRSIKQDNLLRRLRETGAGRVILTASQGSEVSQEKDDLSHGVFTYYLLEGLEGKADSNKDSLITITELYQYVSREVPKATKNTQHPMMDLDEMSGEVVVSVIK